MGRKRKISLGEGIENILKNEVKNIIQNEYESEDSLSELPEEETPQIYQEQNEYDPALERILNTFPSSEGYYGKLYRKNTSGKLEFKYFIDHLEEIEDPELEIANLIKENTWKGGEYVLRIIKKGENKAAKVITCTIASDNTPVAQMINSMPQENKMDSMQNIKEMITTVKELTGTDQGAITKSLSDSFKQGMDLVKPFIAAPTPPQAQAQAPTQMDTMNMMLAMLKMMKETEKPKEDAFEMLLKLKQLGLINMPNENPPINNDPINQVSKISELMQVMAPLMGNSPVEQPSAWMKLVEIVAPAIPQIIANVTQAVQSVTDLSKAKLSNSLGAPLPQSVPSQIGIAGAPLPLNVQTSQNIQNPQEECKSMNPIVKQIYQAVKTKNIEFYPQMKSLIESWVNPYVIQELISGRADLDGFLSQAGVMLGESWFTTDETKTYFEGFITWCKEEHLKNIVVVKCDKCKDYFDVNKADYRHSEKCDCGGLLEAISNNGVTAHAEVAA